MVMRLAVISMTVVALAIAAAPAQADDVAGAAKAFAQAQEVMLAGDYARAADLYELADQLAPSAPALRNAARARLAANHDAMAATDAADLLQRYPNDKESRDVAEAILSKLAPQLTQFDITCDEACTITIDGKAASAKPRTKHLFFAPPGAHAVGAEFDGAREASRQVTTQAGETTRLELHAPPRPVQPVATPGQVAGSLGVRARPVHAHDGLSRVWFVGAAVVTAGLGTAAGLEGMATLDTRDQIKAAVAANDSAKANSLYADGRDQQLRTNILLGATAAAAVGTIVVGVMTNWSGESQAHAFAVSPTPGGATVVLGGRF